MTEHSITRPAHLANCTRCGNLVIKAITSGLTTITDPQPLNTNQEIQALMTGQPTFDLVAFGRNVFLEWRDLIRIRASRDYPVVAQHRCVPGSQPPAPIPAAATVPLPDDPPF